MNPVANAFLTKKYKNENQVPMRTIEVKTKWGRPLLVLQSEDTPLAVEQTLRSQGWNIVSWKGNLLQLEGLSEKKINTQSNPFSQPPKPKSKASTIGCLLIFIIFLVFFVSCTASFSKSVQESASKPKTGSPIEAEVMCEQFVKQKLNAPSTAKFSRQKSRVSSDNPNKYITVGFVEAENRLGGTVGAPYRCNITYNPTNDSWTSDTFLDN